LAVIEIVAPLLEIVPEVLFAPRIVSAELTVPLSIIRPVPDVLELVILEFAPTRLMFGARKIPTLSWMVTVLLAEMLIAPLDCSDMKDTVPFAPAVNVRSSERVIAPPSAVSVIAFVPEPVACIKILLPLEAAIVRLVSLKTLICPPAAVVVIVKISVIDAVLIKIFAAD